MRQIPMPEDEEELDCEGASAFEDDDRSILIITPDEPGSETIDAEIGIVVKEFNRRNNQYAEAMFTVPAHQVEDLCEALIEAAKHST